MAVPGYQEFMLPLLRIAADGHEHSMAEAMETLAAQMHISPEDQALLLPSGMQTRYYNRVTWAVTYLTKSLLLDRIGRGRFRITERGMAVLKQNPARIDNRFLEKFAEYREFKTKRAATEEIGKTVTPDREAEVTPEERLEAAYEELRDALADDLQQRVRAASPKFFETRHTPPS